MSLDPHGGNIYAYDGVKLDFSVNLNPLGMPEEILQAVRDHGLEYDRYPDPNCRALRRALAAREGVPEEWLVFGNGAADLIVRLAMAVKPTFLSIPCSKCLLFIKRRNRKGERSRPFPAAAGRVRA